MTTYNRPWEKRDSVMSVARLLLGVMLASTTQGERRT
jgi:hypothetical protein